MRGFKLLHSRIVGTHLRLRLNESQRNINLYISCVCVYLIVEDDHDKHTKQHRLHQEDDVVSTERERESHRGDNSTTLN